MEFHVWGKLDEHGKIQSVQSSCSHGNAFNFSPGVGHDSGGEAWLGEAGERYVPYATKKELVYKLDTKIDEMSLIMVQLGELTKRLQLQEKLLAEYEEKSERQQAELKKLRAENAELRSMVFKRKRNSSESHDSPGLGVDSSFTLPKTPISTPMECSDGSHERSPTQENLRIPHDIVDVGNVEDVHENNGSESGSSGSNICDSQEKDPSRVVGNALSVDEHGYVPLWGEGELRKQCHEMDHMHLMIDQKGYVQIPETGYDSADRRQPRDWTDSGLDEMDGFANEATFSVQLTVSERTSYPGTRSKEAGPATGSVTSSRGSTIAEPEDIKEADVPAKAKVKPTTPDAHSGDTLPRYCEIPDDLVPRRSSPVKCQVQGHGQQEPGSCHAHSPDKDRYSNRPPMPLPGQRSSGSHVISSKSESSSIPHRSSISKERNSIGKNRSSISKERSSISKEVKDYTNDETREAYVAITGRASASRHSSPDLRTLGNDERLSSLIKTMKTTMEWNEARKSLMLKSTTCTTEHAEDSLREIVKAAYCKYETRVVGKGKQMPTVESLAQGFRNYLRQKRKYDEDLLTKEFLEKCFHLLRTV